MYDVTGTAQAQSRCSAYAAMDVFSLSRSIASIVGRRSHLLSPKII